MTEENQGQHVQKILESYDVWFLTAHGTFITVLCSPTGGRVINIQRVHYVNYRLTGDWYVFNFHSKINKVTN